MNFIKLLPFPAFVVDHSLDVIDMSDTARELFGDTDNFGEIMDVGSQSKKIRLMGEALENPIELTLKTRKHSMVLFAVSVKWGKDEGILQCFEMDNKLENIMRIVQEHQERLAQVDFELLAQKELAESHLKQIKTLSAPLIPLSEKVALVPLFGHCDVELIANSKNRLATELYEKDLVEVVFDFNGIDQFNDDGIDLFQAFVETLYIMGVHSYIVGIKPQHTRFLVNREHHTATYLPTLKDAIALLT